MSVSIKKSGNPNTVYFLADADKVHRFRKRHKIGETVQGRLLRFVGKRQAIIQVEDQKLIAYLQAVPPKNKLLKFSITQLHPYIILKEESTNYEEISILV